MIGLLLALWAHPAPAVTPADLAPSASDLLSAEERLAELLATGRATASATTRLQTAWTLTTAPKAVCADPVRLELGWRMERFGSAWREVAQAIRAQAERVRRIRAASTVAPLVDVRWTDQLDGLLADAARIERALVEASAWQAIWVRPSLAACPAVFPLPSPGIGMLETPVRGELPMPVAVLALGDGWICPGGIRADDAVVLTAREACWSASPTCGCTPTPVEPGAVLGAPVPEVVAPDPVEPAPG